MKYKQNMISQSSFMLIYFKVGYSNLTNRSYNLVFYKNTLYQLLQIPPPKPGHLPPSGLFGCDPL